MKWKLKEQNIKKAKNWLFEMINNRKKTLSQTNQNKEKEDPNQ
jgi:hypothetical protein